LLCIPAGWEFGHDSHWFARIPERMRAVVSNGIVVFSRFAGAVGGDTSDHFVGQYLAPAQEERRLGRQCNP